MKIFTLILCAILFGACQRTSRPVEAERHYPLSGKIVALDSRHRTATIDAAAIPDFMEAMTMEYPVKSKDDFASLRVGEQITATVDVAGDQSYTLSNVKPQAQQK